MDYYSLLQEIEERQFIVDFDEKYVERAVFYTHAHDLLAERIDTLRANHSFNKESATVGLEEEVQIIKSFSDEESKILLNKTESILKVIRI